MLPEGAGIFAISTKCPQQRGTGTPYHDPGAREDLPGDDRVGGREAVNGNTCHTKVL